MRKRCICFCMLAALLVMGFRVKTKVMAMEVSDPFTGEITLDHELTDDSTYISGAFETDTYDGIGVRIAINGEVYEGSVKDEDYAWSFNIDLPDYVVEGTGYDVIIYDVQTGEQVKNSYTVSHSDEEPSLSVSEITCNNRHATGITVEHASVLLKIGKKSFHTTADEDGEFTIKIPYMKIGQKYKVSVVSPINGNGNSVTKTVKKPSIKLDIKAWLTVNTRKINGKVTGAIKADRILVKISGKAYKGKINVKKKSFTVSIPRQRMGAKVTVILQNQFKQELKIYHDKIYLKDGFDIGMTEKQMRATTWGEPDDINYYDSGSFEQWIYYEDDDTLYVYFRNGRLIDWQRV